MPSVSSIAVQYSLVNRKSKYRIPHCRSDYFENRLVNKICGWAQVLVIVQVYDTKRVQLF